jgi:hypothetical protein
LATAAVALPAWAATEPFAGKWKLDVARSTIVDDFQVKSLGSNRYAFNFEGGPTETVIADGTDQPGLPGTTLAVKAVGARNMTVVRKQGGHVLVSAIWTLSPDGQTLRDDFTNVQPDGSRLTTHYLYRRLSGSSGFPGTWESTTPPAGLNLEVRIEPDGGNGLSVATAGGEKTIVFDGRDHDLAGSRDGATLSARRSGPRGFEYTEKTAGKVERVHRFQLARDGRAFTETLRLAGQGRPDVLVFERE